MSSILQLRRATESELELVHSMQIFSFSETLEKYQDFDTNPAAESLSCVEARHNRPNSGYFLIIYNQKPIGAMRIVTDEKQEVARISPMFILPEIQNTGFGSTAVQEAMKLFPNVHTWELDTIEEEKRLCRFYEKLGFRRTGEREHIKDGMSIINYELVR